MTLCVGACGYRMHACCFLAHGLVTYLQLRPFHRCLPASCPNHMLQLRQPRNGVWWSPQTTNKRSIDEAAPWQLITRQVTPVQTAHRAGERDSDLVIATDCNVMNGPPLALIFPGKIFTQWRHSHHDQQLATKQQKTSAAVTTSRQPYGTRD